jgi:hypothetical protein
MKMMWFHLMPYTELPDDFRDKHPSVWVDIHPSLFDPRKAHRIYNDFMASWSTPRSAASTPSASTSTTPTATG